MSRLAHGVLSALLVTALSACGGEDAQKGDTTSDDSGAMTGPDAGGEDAGGGDAGGMSPDTALPIVFIHGFAGSAEQYQSQAIRFVANGYPADRIRAYEHDGAGLDIPGFVEEADVFIDGVRAEFGVEQIFLVGHSRGTFVSNSYLGDPARAAKVAKYIALDGRPCPDVVPCLAVTQASLPGQKHVEVATSAESFVEQYKFLIGEPPAVVDIVPQDGPVEISGRAVDFPANVGRAGAMLTVWAIDSATGARTEEEPLATFAIGEDGHWGPVTLDPSKHYEFMLTADGSTQHHFYPQRFLRSTSFVRLLSGKPDSATRQNTHTGDNHAAIIAMRMREWTQEDVLEITTKRGDETTEVGNIVSERLGDANIAIHIHDDAASPGESTLGELPNLGGPFQTTADVFMPAADPGDGTITITNLPRGDASKPQVLNVPNWASSAHLITLMFADYAQD